MKTNAAYIEAGFSSKKEYETYIQNNQTIVNESNQPLEIIASQQMTAKAVRIMLNENDITCTNTYFLANTTKRERIWIGQNKDKIVAIVIDGIEDVRVIPTN